MTREVLPRVMKARCPSAQRGDFVPATVAWHLPGALRFKLTVDGRAITQDVLGKYLLSRHYSSYSYGGHSGELLDSQNMALFHSHF